MKTKTKTISYEYTNTFGGEANYSWCKNGTIEIPENASDLTIVRQVKAKLGLSNVPCRREDFGEQIKLTPRGSCTVVFID